MGWLLLALAVLILPLQWLIAAFLAASVHELGHYLALRLCRVPVHGVRIGVAGMRMQVGDMGRVQNLICALAGPIAGLSLLLLSQWLPRTAVCACIHSAYNLLPVYPLDGGRALRSIFLGERICQWIGQGCLFLIAFAGLYGCVSLHLGLLPIFMAVLTIRRALGGKTLAKRRDFRYNRGRFYERGIDYDRFDPQNSSHGAKTGPVHRRRV